MERSIKLFFTVTLLTVMKPSLLYAPLQTRLPNNFYIFDKNKSKISTQNLLDDLKSLRAFIIIVGNNNNLPSKNIETYRTLSELFASTRLVDNFIPNLNAKSPYTTLYFDWEDKVGFKNIKEFGSIFADGISQLTNKYNAIPIIISLGRGGLMVNFASHQWAISKITLSPIVIQIGTPIPPYEATYFDLFPKSENIRKFFHFYSLQPFIVDQPTLHPNYSSSYTSMPSIKSYNITVLVNNNQPLQNKLLSLEPLTNSLLEWCEKAQFHFLTNKDLFINFSTLRPETNGIIGISQPNTKVINEQNKKELSYNNEILKDFTKSWSYGPRLSISNGEYLRNSYKINIA